MSVTLIDRPPVCLACNKGPTEKNYPEPMKLIKVLIERVSDLRWFYFQCETCETQVAVARSSVVGQSFGVEGVSDE